MKNAPNSMRIFTKSNHSYKAALIGLLINAGMIAQAQSPTAPARDFNVFIQNGSTMGANTTHGPVAIGGNLTLAGTSSLAHDNAGTFKVGNKAIGLLVGGRVVFYSGNQTYVNNGYVKIGNGTGAKVWYKDPYNNNTNLRITESGYNDQPSINLQTSAATLGVSASNNPVLQSGLIDFAAAFSTMQNNARSMAALPANIELTNPNGDRKGSTIPSVLTNGQIKVNLKPGLNVLNATGSELNSVTGGITFNNAPGADRVLVINVSDEGAFNWNVWNQAGVGLQNAPYIIYNFYNTTSLQIQGSNSIEGTVFAPFADISKIFNAANIDGQVIGLSFYHLIGRINYASFTPSVAGTPKPTTGATKAVYTNLGINSVNLSWTNGNGAGRIVIAQKGSAAGAPADNQSYTANAKFGSGSAIGAGFVVYKGTGNSVTVTNLEEGTLYYFTVIEYNSSGTSIAYGNDQKLASSTTMLADSDNDDVADTDDEYPNDAAKAFNNSFPAANFGTLMFEDLWPYKGDYDFNDLVLDYRFTTVTNAANNVAEIVYSFVPRAIGAGTRNGFAFQLDGISPDKIVSVTGAALNANWVKLNSNGTEAGQAAHANIIVSDDMVKAFKNVPSGTTMINTYTAAEFFTADTIKIVVKFAANAVSYSNLGAAKFNPYLIVNQTRGQEIHLADRMPSAKMDASFFGQADDNSSSGAGRYFKTANNLPWALNVVNSIPYPQEMVEFTNAYPNFIKWAASAGASNTDWYLDKAGNRDASKLYKNK